MGFLLFPNCVCNGLGKFVRAEFKVTGMSPSEFSKNL